MNCVDPSGHDVVFISGHGAGGVSIYDEMTRWADWIKAYKGWSDQAFQLFLDRLSGATDQDAYIRQRGIGVFAFSGGVNDANVAALSDYMVGMSDVTLVGFSLGANMVMNYISAKQAGQLSNGPDVNKFVLIDVPDPYDIVSAVAGGRGPSDPFYRDYYCARTCFGGPARMGEFGGGSVVNLWSEGDMWGNLGELPGAVNLPNTAPPHEYFCCGLTTTHDRGRSREARAAFAALGVNGDYNAYYYGPGR